MIGDSCKRPQTSTTAAVVLRPTGPPDAPVMVRSIICNACTDKAVVAKHKRRINIPMTPVGRNWWAAIASGGRQYPED